MIPCGYGHIEWVKQASLNVWIGDTYKGIYRVRQKKCTHTLTKENSMLYNRLLSNYCNSSTKTKKCKTICTSSSWILMPEDDSGVKTCS